MKKILGMISLLALALFAATLLTPAPALAAKAKAKPDQMVGYVDRQQVFSAYPGIQNLMSRIQTLRNEAQQEYDTNAKDLPSTEKQAYSDKLSRQQAQRENELLKPVGDKIEASIRAVAEENGLTAIVDAEIVLYGGLDITAEVIAKVQ